MSLNGLDNPAVNEAFQTVLHEAGGWFLLKYVSRDEVALFDRGTGGVPDVRNAIDAFEENSPLYGVLQYRRRKVVLSYLPDDVSRLVKARTTVQFQSVLDRFSPHDAVFSFSSASGLSESSLSSTCLLHTATDSMTSSSSGSLRRRKLMKIAEDAEESPSDRDVASTYDAGSSIHQRTFSTLSDATATPSAHGASSTQEPSGSEQPAAPAPTASIASRPSSLAPSRPGTRGSDMVHGDSTTHPTITPDRPGSSRSFQPPTMSATNGSNAYVNNQSSSASISERPSSSAHAREDLPHPSSQSRMSTQSARPAFQDLDRAGTPTMPKVKLGPRPSVGSSGRPRTAGNNTSRRVEQRPVASLPTGMRSSSFRKANPIDARPRSQGSTSATMSGGKAPPVPPLAVPPFSMSIPRSKLSPGAKSLSALSSAGTSHERERLMKAVQMRKAQMEKRAAEGKNIRVQEGRGSEPKVNGSSTEDKENAREQLDRKHQKRVDVSASSKEPLSEVQISVTPESAGRTVEPPTERPAEQPIDQPVEHSVEHPVERPNERPAGLDSVAEEHMSADSSDPESDGETTVSEFAGDEPLITSFPTPGSRVLTDRSAALEALEQRQTAQVRPETETEVVEEEALAVSVDNQTKSGPVSPSVLINVPPEKKPQNPPEKEITVPSSPPPTAKPLVPGEREAEIITKPAESVRPQDVPVPTSPSPDPQPTPVPDSSSVIASPAGEPEHELTPENLNVEQPAVTRQDNPKPFLEPIQVPTPEYSDDDNLLSDDSFMEELTSATVEEAKPISVGKSPLSPGYPNDSNGRAAPDAWKTSRAVTNPSAVDHQSHDAHAATATRSVSSPFTEVDSPSGPVLTAKKVNLSSGISQRIKALEKLSSQKPSPGFGQPWAPPVAPPSLDKLRKRASVSLGGPLDLPSGPPNGSPGSDAFSRASSVARRGSQASTRPTTRRTSSVSVTARIIRSPTESRRESVVEPSGLSGLNLQASPLTVEHDTCEAPEAAQAPEASKAPETPLSQDLTGNHSEVRSMSASSAGSGPRVISTPMPRSESRMSVSPGPKNESPLGSKTPSDIASSPEDNKKESRTSRLLRRMSSMTTSSRKSPPVKEQDIPAENKSPEKPAVPAGNAQAVEIGELNVQFPGTLLWKRRYVRVEGDGSLVLGPGISDSTSRIAVKRYHLSELRTPCLPDEDEQELPNSIILDFLDGRTLQCACESRQGQASVLQTLIGAHSAHR
ncbi:putative GPI-anchored cell surface glycoprotein [Aspergillus candidus]|uniref:GPI-anchored cell surface glycoprotein n=1 Tax=Aspergillus candidus TaxID=41067 RepID=A0A2I2FBW8_ASPCN|nr:hypothetical protein BDW47DRAFT_31956 [Aspergillus candidus]PLB38122.1 hypothetical protein BDW47DRAFT_31956 [Aspergillus candidus]